MSKYYTIQNDDGVYTENGEEKRFTSREEAESVRDTTLGLREQDVVEHDDEDELVEADGGV